MSSKRAGPVSSLTGVKSMITVTYLSPLRVCRQTCSSTPTTWTPAAPVRIIDQGALAFGEDGIVGGVPPHRQTFGDPGDGQVDDHDAFQRPAQRPPGQPGTGFCGLAGVLAPHVAALDAPVAAHPHQQDGRPPPARLVRQPTHHGARRDALAATATAPLVIIDDPAREHRTRRFEVLTDDLKAELIKPGERSQVRTSEGSVGHVEVFQDGQHENSHLRETSTLNHGSTHHPRSPRLTLNCKEPVQGAPVVVGQDLP